MIPLILVMVNGDINLLWRLRMWKKSENISKWVFKINCKCIVMKNEILDTPFRDTFSDFLEKGEKV
ncbi:MAG TPA: hypothetical protein ENJ53_07165 [Phaeodactylibacter sp.]|nr:hypothetical protein [Phaeodactylibacter sp.]